MIRIIGFKDSLNSVEKIDKLVKEFGEGVDRMLTLSTSVTTGIGRSACAGVPAE